MTPETKREREELVAELERELLEPVPDPPRTVRGEPVAVELDRLKELNRELTLAS